MTRRTEALAFSLTYHGGIDAFRNQLKQPDCKAQVKAIMELAASDIRADVQLSRECKADRKKFCDTTKPGDARVIICLKSK